MQARESEIKKGELSYLYLERRLSTWTIAKELGRSRSHIRTLLQRYGIPIRSRAESHRQYPRKAFNGSNEDKAYLLGFTIGDLRTRRQYENSETIGIACSSTHMAQISLISRLFSPYGRVWIGKPNNRGVISCEAFVDHSFSFLLKDNRDIAWVFNKETYFYAFLAGFTDAEGSIFENGQGKLILTWGQCNQVLLEHIRAALQKFGYKVGNVLSDNLAGYKDKSGYVRNKDYYHLTCAARESLLRLLVALKPYIRHDEKVAKSAIVRRKLEKILHTRK